ncbi:MAG TPA: hypothetical protein VJ011_10700 [Steroidobacteraceae bacterium]|nr:hypothetical protein [Steroidobacteraceae bacterium]
MLSPFGDRDRNTMVVRIPDFDRENLFNLLKLEPSARESLYAALKDCSATLRLQYVVDDLVAALEGRVSFDRLALKGIIQLLFNLYWLRADQGLSAAAAAEEIVDAARSDDRFIEPPEGWAKFTQQLAQLLSLDESLGIAAKASFLTWQQPRHLHRARVLTDARPVFGADPSNMPAAFVITHTLQLEFHENGEDQEWFVAVDANDLRSLKDAAERALKKEATLRNLLNKSGLVTMAWQETKDV